MTAKSSIELIYTVTKDSLSAQQIQKNTLESKASTLIGFAGGMLALLFGFKDVLKSLILDPTNKLLIIVSVSCFLFSIFLATIVGWVRKYRSDPNPSALADNYLNKSERVVKLQLISNLLGTWKLNSRLLERNAILLRLAITIQTIGFLLLGIVLILFLI
jgi:hypothetical protein